MRVKEITYERIFPLPEKFSNERLSITIQLGPGDTPKKAFDEAKRQVLRSTTRFKKLSEGVEWEDGL